jgi:hypothetical protein
MSLSFAIFKVPSININPYLSRNKQCAARRGHLRPNSSPVCPILGIKNAVHK